MAMCALLMSKPSPKVQPVPEHSRSACADTPSTALSLLILTITLGKGVVLTRFSIPLRQVRN